MLNLCGADASPAFRRHADADPVAHSIRVPLPGERSDATALLFGREENSPMKKKSALIRAPQAIGVLRGARRLFKIRDFLCSAKIH